MEFSCGSSKGSSSYNIPIMNLKVTIEPEDEAQPFRAGWERLACDLSQGTGQKWIYLWVKREEPTYICEICITDDFASHASLFQDGFIRVDEDTNRRAGGPYIYIWYRQTTDAEQAFNDLQISTNDQEFKSFQKQQYDQVDGDLNKGTKASTCVARKRDLLNPSGPSLCSSSQQMCRSSRRAGSRSSAKTSTQETKAWFSTCVSDAESRHGNSAEHGH